MNFSMVMVFQIFNTIAIVAILYFVFFTLPKFFKRRTKRLSQLEKDVAYLKSQIK
jgi:hypothetical protein